MLLYWKKEELLAANMPEFYGSQTGCVAHKGWSLRCQFGTSNVIQTLTDDRFLSHFGLNRVRAAPVQYFDRARSGTCSLQS